MANNNKFSVVLPVRNGGEYVKECAKSILSQTYTGFNFIVLDNCSTDGTADWFESLKDPRIVIYRSDKPLSIVENWARITTIPKNEFITLIGHDDLLDENYFSAMDKLILKHPNASLYQAHFRYIDANGKYLRNCLPMDEVQYSHEFLACHMTQTMDSMGTGYMMRSKDYDKIGGMPVNYSNLIFADYELWIKLADISYKATTWENCFSYRKHQSVSRIVNGMQYQQAFGEYVQFIKRLMDQNDLVKNVVQHYAIDMLMYYCESLSHRLLKTPLNERQLSVSDYINLCIRYANELIPGQSFEPMKKWRIRLAAEFDKNAFNRTFFKIGKSFGIGA